MDWPFTLQRVLAREPCVLVTLNLILGSAPRESGSRMIVAAEAVHGSIGGGNLEYTAIGRARELLAESGEARQLHQPFGLGPVLNQCCGGAVTVLFEVLPRGRPAWLQPLVHALEAGESAVLASAIDRPLPEHVLLETAQAAPEGIPEEVRAAARALLAADPPERRESAPLAAVERDGDTWWLEPVGQGQPRLLLFGAGHVGREVARLLSRLPFTVTWVDSRHDAFDASAFDDSTFNAGAFDDAAFHDIGTAGRITTLRTDDPVGEVRKVGPAGIYVVMTHSHQLDEELCFAVLQRDDFAWLGLIGSDTKRRRFAQRLQRRGIPVERLERLVCPIGLNVIRGKQPATIALSLVAQLMSEQPWITASKS
jgi:xanthine dehydrogenase accessory factor